MRSSHRLIFLPLYSYRQPSCVLCSHAAVSRLAALMREKRTAKSALCQRNVGGLKQDEPRGVGFLLTLKRGRTEEIQARLISLTSSSGWVSASTPFYSRTCMPFHSSQQDIAGLFALFPSLHSTRRRRGYHALSLLLFPFLYCTNKGLFIPGLVHFLSSCFTLHHVNASALFTYVNTHADLVVQEPWHKPLYSSSTPIILRPMFHSRLPSPLVINCPLTTTTKAENCRQGANVLES